VKLRISGFYYDNEVPGISFSTVDDAIRSFTIFVEHFIVEGENLGNEKHVRGFHLPPATIFRETLIKSKSKRFF